MIQAGALCRGNTRSRSPAESDKILFLRPSAKALLLVLIGAFWNVQGQVREAIGGGPPGGAVRAIVFDPKDPATLYAATDWSGVFKSTDGGESWTAINAGLANSSVYSLAVSPSEPATLYAGTRNGVFKTTDGGRSWTSSSSGLPKEIGRSIIEMLAINPVNPQILYAGNFDRIFKTIDGGKNWITCVTRPIITQTSRFEALAVGPSHPATVYAAAADSGLLRSIDGGKKWAAIRTGAAAYSVSVLVDPSDPSVIYAYDGEEILKTTDSGKHWTGAKLFPQTYSLALAISRKEPRTLYAGTSKAECSRALTAAKVS